jgi:hypothetical protein
MACPARTAVPVLRPAALCRGLGIPMVPPRPLAVRRVSARRGGTKGLPPVGPIGRSAGRETALSSAARSDGLPVTAQTPPASQGGRERESAASAHPAG